MIRVAAVGDVHYDKASAGRLKPYFDHLAERADILLMAGDLTTGGMPDETLALAEDLRDVSIPIVAVLGDHDYHRNNVEKVHTILRDAGIIVLEGQTAVLKVGDKTVGVAGIKGFGGGFASGFCPEFGEPETKAFAHHAKVQADRLRECLQNLETDFRFALTHYSPIEGTLLGERKEIFPFLGSYLLAEAIDAAGADAAFHGHAHAGTERGCTPGGVPVRNVALPVIRHAFNIYTFESTQRVACTA